MQWVGGEPTIHLPAILDVMSRCPDLPPVVWKSDFYGTPEAFDLLRGVVAVHVADFKFGNDACARRLAGVDDFLRVARNLLSRADGSGQILACEVCVATPAIRKLIREGESHLILNEIQTGKKHQMQSMDSALADLYQRGEITYDTAVSAARDPNQFRHRVAS